MPTTVTLRRAEADLGALLDRAAAGEEFVITVDGRPAARLVPIGWEPQHRQFGQLAGKVRMADDFDQTPQWLIEAFES